MLILFSVFSFKCNFKILEDSLKRRPCTLMSLILNALQSKNHVLFLIGIEIICKTLPIQNKSDVINVNKSVPILSQNKGGNHINIFVYLIPINTPTFQTVAFFYVKYCNTITFLLLHQIALKLQLSCYFHVTLKVHETCCY